MKHLKTMKAQNFVALFVAILVAVFATSIVMADINMSSMTVSVSDVDGSVVGAPGETVPVEVRFTSNEDLEDAKLKVWISGYKDDIEASTGRFDVIAGKSYIKTLNVKLPNTMDIEDLDEDLALHVEISDKNDDYEAPSYTITVQKDSYDYGLLSVEAPSAADAGEVIAIDVVLKNTGRHELEDSFVIARIPELDVYKKVYFGDIAPEDNFDGDDDAEDARERRIYLVVPADALSGDYDLTVKASNYDASEEVVKTLTVDGITEGSTITAEADDEEGVPSSIIVLTVVLVIIFLVLLVVLIVLLTKKPEERIEDFGETSYY